MEKDLFENPKGIPLSDFDDGNGINSELAFNDKRIHKMLFEESWHATRNGWQMSWKHKKNWYIIANDELSKLPKSEYEKLRAIYNKRIAKYGRAGICAYDVSKFPV